MINYDIESDRDCGAICIKHPYLSETKTTYLDTCGNKYSKKRTPQKKETTMTTAVTIEANYDLRNQRHALDDALYSTESEKREELRDFFHLNDDKPPRNPVELVERIQAGKFMIPEVEAVKSKEGKSYYDPYNHIRWRDPAVLEDKAGFEAASAQLSADAEAVRLDLAILDPKDGLKALRDFQAKTYH